MILSWSKSGQLFSRNKLALQEEVMPRFNKFSCCPPKIMLSMILSTTSLPKIFLDETQNRDPAPFAITGLTELFVKVYLTVVAEFWHT